jgi:Lrp/AsnC family transcriptional regulator for asnA, asnC and gidA
MPSPLDALDAKLIEHLMQDGRLSSAALARRLRVSERTARYRLQRLLDQGLIRVVAMPIPSRLGYTVVADVFMQVEPGSIQQVAEKLATCECVTYVGCSMGESDVSVQVIGRDNQEVYAFVTDVIGRLPGVRKTTTVIVPVVLKDVYQWRVPKASWGDAEPSLGDEVDRAPGAGSPRQRAHPAARPPESPT